MIISPYRDLGAREVHITWLVRKPSYTMVDDGRSWCFFFYLKSQGFLVVSESVGIPKKKHNLYSWNPKKNPESWRKQPRYVSLYDFPRFHRPEFPIQNPYRSLCFPHWSAQQPTFDSRLVGYLAIWAAPREWKQQAVSTGLLDGDCAIWTWVNTLDWYLMMMMMMMMMIFFVFSQFPAST